MKGYPGLLLAQLGLVLTTSLFAAIIACRAVAPGWARRPRAAHRAFHGR